MNKLVALVIGALWGCNVGFAQGPDRPDENGTFGPAPPADFHCEAGDPRHQDRNGDKKPDYVLHVSNGVTICHGEDEDYDGRIDHWTQYENGKPVRHARTKGGGYVTTYQDAGASP